MRGPTTFLSGAVTMDTDPTTRSEPMDRCLLCGEDPDQHADHCPDAAWTGSRSVFDADEVARGRAALERDATESISTTELTSTIEEAPDPAVPWSIPVREPAVVSTRTARPPIDPEQKRLAALVAGGVALLVFALVGASLIGGGSSSSPDTQVAGSEVRRVQDPTTTVAPPAETTASSAIAPTTTDAPEASVDDEEEEGEEQSDETTTTAAAAAASDTGDVPILSPGEIGRGWVAQVSSVPQRSGGQALQTAYATVTRSAPDAVAIRSDQWPAMQSGFWVIVIPWFDTGESALGGCDAAGQSSDCFGRFLSAVAEQNERTCRRSDGGGTSGYCGA